MASKKRKSVPTSSENATVEEAAALLRVVLNSVDSAEVPVGSLPRETATRRRVEGAAAALEALVHDGETGGSPRTRRRRGTSSHEGADGKPPRGK